MQVLPDDARRSFCDAPVRRLLAEAYCLGLTFVFHQHNNDARKGATLLLVGAWAVIEAGSAFGYATLPDQFLFLRILVGVLIGRMWGIEINNFAGVEFDYQQSSEQDNNE